MLACWSIAIPVQAAETAPPSSTTYAPAAGQASAADAQGASLNEVVVRGRFLSEEVYDPLGGRVAVVGEEQLRELDAHDLAESLRRIPGITVSRYDQVGSFGGGDGGGVFIRGMGTGRPGGEMVTLLDGLPRFVGIWSHPLLDLTPPDLAKRIEVYKDPQPVKVGNMGFGAVNIVPRRRTEPGFEGRASGSVGFTGEGTGLVKRGRISQGGSMGGADYYFSGGQAGAAGHRDYSAGSARDLYGRLGYGAGTALDASAQVLHQASLAQDPGPETAPSQPGKVPEYSIKSDFFAARVKNRAGALESEVSVYLDRGRNNWTNQTPGWYTTDIRTNNCGGRIRATLRLLNGSEVILGYDDDRYGGENIERKSTGTRQSNPPQFANMAPWVFVSQEFGDELKFIPSAGVRRNMSRYFGNQWGYQSGMEASYAGTRSWVRYARAYNLPGVYAAHLLSGDTWKGLSPELMDAYEAGLGQNLPWGLAWDGTWWRHDVRSSLRIHYPPPPPLTMSNLGKARTTGVETNLRWRPSGILDAYSGACYADSDPADLPDLPRWSLAGGFNAAWAGIKLGYDIQYLESYNCLNPRSTDLGKRVPGYVLMNARVGYGLPRCGALGGEIWLTCANLANRACYNRPGYPMPGRNYVAGLDVFF